MISWGFGTTGWFVKDKQALLSLKEEAKKSTLQVDSFFGRNLNNCKYYKNLFNHHSGSSTLGHGYKQFKCGMGRMDEKLVKRNERNRDCNHNFYFDRWVSMGVSGSLYAPSESNDGFCLT
jgi:hypothetical protein